VRPRKHKNGIQVNRFLKNLKNLSLTTKYDNETTSKPGKEEQWGGGRYGEEQLGF
jgi:hypothetical protein